MVRIALLVVFLPLASLAREAVSRPGVLHLTQETAVQMALSKNFAIQVQRFGPSIARQNERAQMGVFDPVLDFSGTRRQNDQKTAFGAIRRTPFSSFSATNDVSTGISGLTPSGLRYDAGLGSLGRTGSGTSGNEYTSTASLALVQPLLRGFGTNSTMAQTRIARTRVQVSEWELRQQIIETVTNTTSVYNQLHLAHENFRVAVGFRALALQLLTDNTKRAEIGVMSPLDVTTARAEAAAREEAVIVTQRQVKDNENLLKQLVASDLEKMLSVEVEIEPPPVPAFTADVPAAIQEALKCRPDYQQSLLELQRQKILVAFTKNQALPRVDLSASLSYLGMDDDWGTSANRIGRKDSTEWTTGMIFSIPIPNREGRANAAAAKLAAAQSLVNLQRLEQQIVVDVDNASGLIVTARQRIASSSQARVLAKESLHAGEERLRAGTGTTFEVLELQKKLAETEAAELRSRADYNRAVGDFYRQTGTTLKVYNITAG